MKYVRLSEYHLQLYIILKENKIKIPGISWVTNSTAIKIKWEQTNSSDYDGKLNQDKNEKSIV